MKKVQGNMKSCLQPTPKVLVSCRDANGKDNALAVGYCGNCSYDPPMVMVGIVPSRYSYNMIKETGVVASPGTGFGEYGEGYVRFALVEPEKVLKKAIEKIKDLLEMED